MDNKFYNEIDGDFSLPTEISAGLYRHFKGTVYRVIYIAKHTETLEDMVIYVNNEDDEKIWARPASMWYEVVEREGGRYLRYKKMD